MERGLLYGVCKKRCRSDKEVSEEICQISVKKEKMRLYFVLEEQTEIFWDRIILQEENHFQWVPIHSAIPGAGRNRKNFRGKGSGRTHTVLWNLVFSAVYALYDIFHLIFSSIRWGRFYTPTLSAVLQKWEILLPAGFPDLL